jgi:MFS transporter, DHA2 family, methylenomycin A resistance protein
VAATPAHPGRVLATVTAAQVLSVASATVVAVALPALARDLGADGAEQQWVIDSFVLVFASLLVAGGVLGDRYGRRRALLVGLALFATGSLWCALAPSVEPLLVGRVVQGTGPALVLPASLAIVGATYSEPLARARAVGIWGAGSGTGVALGPLVGGGLVEAFGWRAVFAINVPACALLAVAALRNVVHDRPAPARHPFDAPAAVLVTLAVAAVTFTVIEGRQLGWTSAPVLGAVAGAAVLLTAFVRHERGHPAPLVDLAVLRERRFVAANLGGAVLFGALTGSAVYLSVFLQQVQDRGALEAGLVLLPQGVLIAATSPLTGAIVARVGTRPPILAGMTVCCVALLGLVTLDGGTSALHAGAVLGLLGIGTGLALPPMTATALGAVRSRDAGMASALHNASRQLGQTFGVAVLGAIVVAHAEQGAFLEGLHLAVATAAGAVAAAGVAIAWLVPREARTGMGPVAPTR